MSSTHIFFLNKYFSSFTTTKQTLKCKMNIKFLKSRKNLKKENYSHYHHHHHHYHDDNGIWPWNLVSLIFIFQYFLFGLYLHLTMDVEK